MVLSCFKGQTPGPGANDVTVEFAETPPMSTYLVAAVVSDMKTLGPVQVENKGVSVPLRVFAVPHLVEHSRLALLAGKLLMEFYINYFDIEYPLKKMGRYEIFFLLLRV